MNDFDRRLARRVKILPALGIQSIEFRYRRRARIVEESTAARDIFLADIDV